LRAGAARIGGGNLGQRIEVKTGDELETLADQFNDMAGRLQESYADLEKKVDVRTHELAQSLEELRALGEVSQAVNSTLEVETLLNTIVAKAVQLSGTEAGAIYVCDESSDEFLLRATCGMSESLIVAIKAQHVGGADAVGRAAARRDPIHVADVRDEPASAMQEILLREGYRALLVVPLLSPDRAIGALVIRRKQPGLFRQQTATCCRPLRPSPCSRSKTPGCSGKSRKKADSSRSPISPRAVFLRPRAMTCASRCMRWACSSRNFAPA
jgi:nitrate/nitrite-specific signal transduction histidine kinase